MIGCKVTILLFASLLFVSEISGRNFSIDYERDTFLMDGEPFRYVSGSMHYFRCPSELWRDRLRKMKEAGLNAVSTYVEWSQHEPSHGVYNFDGDLDLPKFLETAAEEGLYVLLRPGPYICAERDMGGFPAWLLKNQPDIYLRTMDKRFTTPTEAWLRLLLQQLQPYYYGNGGPIIMVQVENEYGFYSTCDRDYQIWLRDIMKQYVGDSAILYTTDGSGALSCGKIPDVHATIDFGPGTDVNQVFSDLRKFEPRGPLANSEFYPGWLTHWGEGMAHRDTADVVKTLEEILEAGANVNFYMFHGGTNFGFTAGANGDDGSNYQADITSYDYDAPLTEAGQITPKYTAIRDTILKYFPDRNVPVTEGSKTASYSDVTLTAIANIMAPTIRSSLGKITQNETPKTFESLDQNFGYLLYEATSPSDGDNQDLTVAKIRDRATVYINEKPVGVLDRETNQNTVSVSTKSGDKIGIFVENLGRINFGWANNDSKGILSDVTLGGTVLQNWDMTSYELDDIEPLAACFSGQTGCQGNGYTIYTSRFSISNNYTGDYLPDTFLDVSKLDKGLVFVNGRNVGRYWSSRGPQYSVYIPGPYLKASPEENQIVLMDEKSTSETLTLSFKGAAVRNRN